jgi:Zn-dependent peptidase ImmA (M78 family)/DNA-binding XRE family transcriptional regulator
MTTNLIGARIKALREERKLSQDELARMFGFKDRQTVSAIETGERRVSAEELLLAVERLGASLDYFTDPFQLAGEGKFSWRRDPRVGPESIKAFERIAGSWIAANRTLAGEIGRPEPILRHALKLAPRSSFEEAMAAGERFAKDFELGAVPAEKLPEAMEQKLGILVLMADAIDGVSGAACRLPDLDAVLINRHEVAGRRNFDLAHELFHILTWDAMPPEHLEEATETSKIRVEQLANSFASALLMPEASLRQLGVEQINPPAQQVLERSSFRSGDTPSPEGGMIVGFQTRRLAGPNSRARRDTPTSTDGVVRWLKETADRLQVTATALKWRLVALKLLDPAQANAISANALRKARRSSDGEPPPLFSKPFMDVLGQAIDEGRVSARRVADLLHLTIEDLRELFARYSVEAPLDL